MTLDQSLREHLEKLLIGRQAHVQFEEVLADVPFDLQGARPEGA